MQSYRTLNHTATMMKSREEKPTNANESKRLFSADLVHLNQKARVWLLMHAK